MKLTVHDWAPARSRPRDPTGPQRRERSAPPRVEERRHHQFYSAGHIRMFRQLRGEGYSWRQIATICGTPLHAPRNAVARADQGVAYPPVTLTVLECRRTRAGTPAGRRTA